MIFQNARQPCSVFFHWNIFCFILEKTVYPISTFEPSLITKCYNFFITKRPSLISTAASTLCLALTIVTYFLFSELRNLPGLNIMALSIDTFTYQLIFLFWVNEETTVNHPAWCQVKNSNILVFYKTNRFWGWQVASNVQTTVRIASTSFMLCKLYSTSLA